MSQPSTTSPAELVVFSHLRWTFVWQRPQHLLSRLAAGRRVVFVEEPLAVRDLPEPVLRHEHAGAVTRVWLEVPGDQPHVCFTDPAASCYGERLGGLLDESSDRAAWLYTPMALDVVDELGLPVLVYDVMDDLAAFAGAPPGLRHRQLQLLERAAVVFTGGRSLHRAAAAQRHVGIHCLPSGVEPDHYAPARSLRAKRTRPVAGYVGVIDERLDLDLLGELAARLPDWDVEIVGPVVKIDPRSLPQAPNLRYPGPADYADLPRVMAGFDVALMPFALNEATRSISPTKTLEYLAAGLPVVSTPVPDVVADFSAAVAVRVGAAGFADACRQERSSPSPGRGALVDRLLHRHHWDVIAARMDALLGDAHRISLLEETA